MGTTLSSEGRYIILVRHASRDFASDNDESKQSMLGWKPKLIGVKPDFKEKGLPRTLAMANRLVDELGPVAIKEIRHSPHEVSKQTAVVYRTVAQQRTTHAPATNPDVSLDPDRGSASAAAETLYGLANSLPAGSAIVLVGHQPMLTLLARILTDGKLPAYTLPIDGSEAACLEMGDRHRFRLLWLLTEKTPELMEDLKEKIKSKYDVAKFFLGAFVVNTGLVLSGTIWGPQNDINIWLAAVGFILTLIALSLTAATLISYDALLMPTDFWTGQSAGRSKSGRRPEPRKWSVLRPPSQAQIVIFYEMVHIWRAFFIPALFCAFAAIAAFLVALADGHFFSIVQPAGDGSPALLTIIAIIAIGAVATLAFLYYGDNQPNLGFED